MYRPPEPPPSRPPDPRKAPLEFGKHLVVSTAHVSLATSQLLANWASLPVDFQPLTVAATWYGWFVSTFVVEGDDAARIPPELAEVQRFARSLDCAYILFDCDADEVDGLKRFNW